MFNVYLDNRDERFMPTVQDLLDVGLADDGDVLVSLNDLVPEVHAEYKKLDMLPYTGHVIMVRGEIVMRLREAYHRLQRFLPGYNLSVCYGYRHPDVQRKYYEARFLDMKSKHPELSETNLMEETHKQVAFPEVAGHPTGGAIDVTIISELGVTLDMGCDIACYSEPEKCYTFNSAITQNQLGNRLILRDLLMSVGFAPFNGEWWHFSYGDREWAYFYGNDYSLFSETSQEEF
jgi:D-alanyl-D-alanine dipeptidase